MSWSICVTVNECSEELARLACNPSVVRVEILLLERNELAVGASTVVSSVLLQ